MWFLCRVEFEQLNPQKECGQECTEKGKWLYLEASNPSNKWLHPFFDLLLCWVLRAPNE